MLRTTWASYDMLSLYTQSRLYCLCNTKFNIFSQSKVNCGGGSAMGVLCAIFAFSFLCRAFLFYPLPWFISSTWVCICFVPRALFCITLSSASYSEYPAHCFAPKDGAQYPSQGPPCYQRYWAKASKLGHFYQKDELKLAFSTYHDYSVDATWHHG